MVPVERSLDSCDPSLRLRAKCSDPELLLRPPKPVLVGDRAGKLLGAGKISMSVLRCSVDSACDSTTVTESSKSQVPASSFDDRSGRTGSSLTFTGRPKASNVCNVFSTCSSTSCEFSGGFGGAPSVAMEFVVNSGGACCSLDDLGSGVIEWCCICEGCS